MGVNGNNMHRNDINRDASFPVQWIVFGGAQVGIGFATTTTVAGVPHAGRQERHSVL